MVMVEKRKSSSQHKRGPKENPERQISHETTSGRSCANIDKSIEGLTKRVKKNEVK